MVPHFIYRIVDSYSALVHVFVCVCACVCVHVCVHVCIHVLYMFVRVCMLYQLVCICV